ncbi:MAG: molybdate ABC transporter substrate-binding protein [Epsilonproteobacteria bacterium]|nr:molybdate ABC transporter substrate-binding protein [Campylobacterota bacterium]
MKKFIIALIFGSYFISAQTITVAAAANLKYALTDIAKEFTKQSGIKVNIITGASGKLTQQIMSGAPFDALLSADMEYPAKLAKGGYTTTPSRVYAYGTLILWSANGADLSKGVAGLASPTIKRVAIANPSTAPYGQASMNALRYYKVEAAVKPKFINGESINQVATYVTTKAVDVGFMAKPIVFSPTMKNVGKWVEVDPRSYNKIEQAMVGLKNGSPQNQIAAKKFLRFMASAKARDILKINGFSLPN